MSKVEILGNVQFIGETLLKFGRKSRFLVSGPDIGSIEEKRENESENESEDEIGREDHMPSRKH
ncbi:hypothetical protein Prudu_191S000600 [Prunus dulcis]|uniref:Uncharacterized protein n=1 Tax=Prunus dulcis TaxID=3755 RepID=A0A5H2XYC5_PRUDU|nr:hypothetical protein Prudu_191S000600 [Prunus dulcis]